MSDMPALSSDLSSLSALAEDKAMDLIREENYAAALGQLRYVAQNPARRVFAYCATGACFYKLKRLRSAERWLRKALSLDPSHSSSRLNLANTLLDLKQTKKAVDLYLTLLQEDPNNVRFQINACHALAKEKRRDEANALLNRILDHDPLPVGLLLELSSLLEDSTLLKRLIPLLRNLIQQQPDCAEAYYRLGQCLLRLNRHDNALPFAIKATELRPDHLTYLEFLINLLNDLSLPEQAISVCEQILKTRKEMPSLLLHYHLLTPVVFRSSQELHHYWARALAGLRALQRQRFTCLISPYLIYPHLFFLAYHNQNLRVPLSIYNDLLARLYGIMDEQPVHHSPETSIDATAKVPSIAQLPDRPIRIGFASQYFSEHSNSRAFEGLISNLNRERFELILIHGPNAKEDDMLRSLNRCAQRIVHIKDTEFGFPDPDQIIDLNLEILFYPDLGMNCEMNSLAMRRLAPIQMTGWGLPHTSGIRSIDYYISSDLAEPPNGDDHYVETLVRLPGLPCCYPSKRLVLHELPRSFFVLPADAQIFGCLQSLYKLHPDFDVALEQLAINNPDAAFVFVENPKARVTHRFLDRVKVTAPHFHDQLVMLAIMNWHHFIALSSCIDVLLDPFYYCSGITFYESTFVGTPTVTLEGRFLRSRFVAAAYRLMGIDTAPIAHSVEEYVAIASRLIQNRDELALLRQELREKAALHLYDDLNYVRGFEAFCEEAVVRHGLRPARSF